MMCVSVCAGIGDGGNELGMGKVKEKVESLMPKGGLIACEVPADHAVTAGTASANTAAVAASCCSLLQH